MSDEARRPIWAGQAYRDSIQDDPASQATLRRVQAQLQAFGQATRAALEPANAARGALASAVSGPMRVYHQLGAALGDAVRDGQFDRLHALVMQYPALKQAADELEQAVRESRRFSEERQSEIEHRLQHVQAALPDLCSVTPPAFEEPGFWSSITPIGEQIRDAVREALREQRPPKGRMKREVAEPLIAQHLMQRPHDTAAQVAERVECSVGVVAESQAWKLNQRRLEIARQQGIDPKAVKLNEQSINAAGGGKLRQLHYHRQQADGIIGEIDAREQDLFRRIGEYQWDHPDATPEQVASGVGCTAGDVERRQAILDRLAAEQADDQQEDTDVEDPDTKRGTRRKWVPKRP